MAPLSTSDDPTTRGVSSSNSPTSVTDHHYYFLDALRGIAALSVFLSHALERIAPTSTFQGSVFWFGNFGVVLFFLCSGFIIPVSLDRHGSLRRFWIRRVCRLYPLYWMSLAIVVFINVMNVTMPGLQILSAAGVFANVTMLQSLFGFSHGLVVYWTLFFELLFYVVVSCLFLFRLHTRSIANATALVLLALSVQIVLPLALGLKLPVDLIVYMATMFVGTAIHQALTGKAKWSELGGLLLLTFFMVMLTSTGGTLNARIAAYLLFFVVVMLRRVHWPEVLIVLGRISYSLYLLHVFVIHLVPTHHSPMLSVTLWLAVSVLVALGTYHWIEQPGIALGLRLTGGKRKMYLTDKPIAGVAGIQT